MLWQRILRTNKGAGACQYLKHDSMTNQAESCGYSKYTVTHHLDKPNSSSMLVFKYASTHLHDKPCRTSILVFKTCSLQRHKIRMTRMLIFKTCCLPKTPWQNQACQYLNMLSHYSPLTKPRSTSMSVYVKHTVSLQPTDKTQQHTHVTIQTCGLTAAPWQSPWAQACQYSRHVITSTTKPRSRSTLVLKIRRHDCRHGFISRWAWGRWTSLPL